MPQRISIRISNANIGNCIPDRRHFRLAHTFFTIVVHRNLDDKRGIRKMTQMKHEASIACLLVTNLPVKAERSRYPVLRHKPLVIVEKCGDSDTVLDSSPEAEGIVYGMTLLEALEVCSNATVMQADRRYYRDADDRIADALERRFGNAERAGPGRAYVRADRVSGAPYGEAHLIATLLNVAPTGFNPRVGVGPGKFIAYAMAAIAPDGGAVKAPDDPVVLLRDCSIDLLPVSEEKILRLHNLGVHTLGALADAPLGEVQSSLGADAGPARDLAMGIDARPLPHTTRLAA